MLRSRVIRMKAASLDDLSFLVATVGTGSHVSIDLENTLIPTSGSLAESVATITKVLRQLRSLPNITEVVVMTNRSLTDSEMAYVEGAVIDKAGKPAMRKHPGFRTDVVIGDQYGADGLLAWRLGIPFIHWELSTRDLPWPTRVVEWFLRRSPLKHAFWRHAYS